MTKLSKLMAALTIAITAATPATADFIIRDVHSTGTVDSLADADALLAGSNIESQATATRPFIDFFDDDRNTGEGTGNFSNNLTFPNDTPGVDDDDFAIRATGTLVIPTAGTYTFGVNSDDGSRLRIDTGSGFVTVIEDDEVHAPRDTFGTVNFASAGNYALEFVYFERASQATVELFAAQGTFTSFDPAFRLVGDTANGGLQVVSGAVIPEPSSIVMAGLGALGMLGCEWRRRRANYA